MHIKKKKKKNLLKMNQRKKWYPEKQGRLRAATASGTLHFKWQCTNQRWLKYSRGQQGKSGWRGMLMRNLLLAVTEVELSVALITILYACVLYPLRQK